MTAAETEQTGASGDLGPTSPLRDATDALRQALPIIVSHMLLTVMGAVDTAFVGHVSAHEVSVLALANTAAACITVLGVGLIMASETFVSQAFGSGDRATADRFHIQSLWLALFIAVPAAALYAVVPLVIVKLGVSQALATEVRPLLYLRALGLFSYLVVGAFRCYFGATNQGRKLVWISSSALALCLVLNLFFVSGMLGGPRWGALGIVVAEVCTWTMSALALIVAFVRSRRGRPPADLAKDVRPRIEDFRRMVSLGLPLGLQLLMEVAAFFVIASLISRRGEAPLATHYVLVTIAGFVPAIAQGLAISTTARIGQAVGKGARAETWRIGRAGVIATTCLLGACGALILLFDTSVVRIFVGGDDVVGTQVRTLLLLCVGFIVASGFVDIAGSALQGIGDTKVPFLIQAIGLWLFLLPLGYLLDTRFGLGMRGYWIAYPLLRILVALALWGRFRRLSRAT